MSTMTEFLTEQLDRDEERASSGWSRMGDDRWESTNEGQSVMTPRAVLADIAAKRRLVELCATWIAEGERWAGVRDVMATAARAQAITAETILRTLVQPYAERDAFDPAWRLG